MAVAIGPINGKTPCGFCNISKREFVEEIAELESRPESALQQSLRDAEKNVAILSDACETWEIRHTALQQSHDRLLEALEVYMSQFGQALEAHGINYGPAQVEADQQARAAIAEATPQEEKNER